MKIVIQRVSFGKVTVAEKTVGEIGAGAVVLLGVAQEDTREQAAWLANKLVHLRMFADQEGKMNLSLLESKGEVLIISQFTLYGNCAQGRRPSFTQSAPPDLANALYNDFIEEVKKHPLRVETGLFGEDMKVSLLNDGPVTFILEK